AQRPAREVRGGDAGAHRHVDPLQLAEGPRQARRALGIDRGHSQHPRHDRAARAPGRRAHRRSAARADAPDGDRLPGQRADLRRAGGGHHPGRCAHGPLAHPRRRGCEDPGPDGTRGAGAGLRCVVREAAERPGPHAPARVSGPWGGSGFHFSVGLGHCAAAMTVENGRSASAGDALRRVVRRYGYGSILLFALLGLWWGVRGPVPLKAVPNALYVSMIVLILALELWMPFRPRWGDIRKATRADVIYFLLAAPLDAVQVFLLVGLLAGTVQYHHYLRVVDVWPTNAPILVQLFLATLLVDFF